MLNADWIKTGLSPANRADELRLQQGLRLVGAVLFVVGMGLFALFQLQGVVALGGTALWFIVVAASVAAYMAMNVGANDVANHMGPVVGSGAITLGWALLIASLAEVLGALAVGGEVVATVRGGVIRASALPQPEQVHWVMLAALLAAALWLNTVNVIGAPVSTTHTIIGAIIGAGVAAGGWGVVQWSSLASIVVSWLVSPLLGAGLAALFLYLIKRTITYQSDMTAAAARVVPVLMALMAWAFVTFMLVRGALPLFDWGLPLAAAFGLALALGVYGLVRRPVAAFAQRQRGDKDGVNVLFTWPLVLAAAMLSFAHGANDVANAVAPLVTILESLKANGSLGQGGSMWTLLLGGLGLAVGLTLYGARMIRIVGQEITELDRIRAYAIAMSASVTVILATELGLPVSTTHVAVGAVFGVGFLRELLKVNYARMEATVRTGFEGAAREQVDAYLAQFAAASVDDKKRMLSDMKKRAKQNQAQEPFGKKERKALKRVYQQELVKRTVVARIVVAWLVTVPVAGGLAAGLYRLIASQLLR